MPRTIPAINLVDVTMSDLLDIAIQRGETPGSLVAVIGYRVRRDTGEVHYTGELRDVPVTGSARTELAQWASQYLPAINEQENM